MQLLQAIDGRIEGVKQHCTQDQRKQHGLHELQQQDDDGDGHQDERDIADLDR